MKHTKMKNLKTKVYQYIANQIYDMMEMSLQIGHDSLFERLMWWGVYLDVHCVYQEIYLD